MYAWEAIQSSLDFIEDHLSENVRTETLAKTAALSPYYYQRLFGRLVKKPVNEYVKLRKLARASEALKNKGIRITDVALEYGFSDHANFTRAFKEAYGITPEEYRAHPIILNHFIKPDLGLDYAQVEEGVPFIADGIVVEVNRRNMNKPRSFVGIEGEIPEDDLTGGKATGVAYAGMVWQEFHRQKPNLPKLLAEGNELGILYKGKARNGFCTYMAGAEASEAVKTDKIVTYTIPTGEYVVCGFEAENFSELTGSALHKAYSFMKTWMNTHGLIGRNFIAELYYNTTPDANYMELWLPIRPSAKEKQTTEQNFDKTDGENKPSMAEIRTYINSHLFEDFCKHLETEYQCKPQFEYSKCSMQFGWNIKYKKGGRSLCTIYPSEGSFLVLVVISDRERAEAEWLLPFCTEYLQQLYFDTKTGMGQKWLMIDVKNSTVLEDVKRLIAIRSTSMHNLRQNTDNKTRT